MNKHIQPGGKKRIPYLLRCAFLAAEDGDAVEAMHFWKTAIDEGYIVRERTHRQLLFRIREGESSSLDPAKDAKVSVEPPPVPRPVDIARRIARKRQPDPGKLD